LFFNFLVLKLTGKVKAFKTSIDQRKFLITEREKEGKRKKETLPRPYFVLCAPLSIVFSLDVVKNKDNKNRKYS